MASSEAERIRWSPRLDDEEILRGRRRRADGGIWGPAIGPMHDDVHRQRIRKILDEGQELFNASTKEAIETVRAVMLDDKAPHQARLKAAEMILERVYGKAPQRVEMTGSSPFEQLLMGLVLKFGGGDQPQLIEADSWEADDEIIWEDDDDG